jgi:hypothetical protein
MSQCHSGGAVNQVLDGASINRFSAGN